MINVKPLLLVAIFSLMLSENLYSHVVLNYPTGGETFQGGEVVTIQWQVIISHGPADWDLFFSEDGGSSWQPIAENLPEAQLTYNWTVPNLATDSAQIRVIQDNVTGEDYSAVSGSFTINISTGINEYNDHADNFILFPAYPNPFNPATVISWQLVVGSSVRLSVFNLTGQSIALLVDEKQSAGYHSIEWHALGFPGGVYFYRLEVGANIETRKIILMK